MENEIVVNGTTYIVKNSVPSGNRVVLVVDRGWIFAGNIIRANGRITLTRVVHVLRWESIGFDGMLATPKSSKVALKPINYTVDLPEDAEVFCVSVPSDWGL